MSPDFHRHGLFHPGRSAVSQLSKAPSVVGRIRKEACNPHTGFEPVALRLCQSRTTAAGGFIIFSPPSFQDPAACFSATTISAGERGRMGLGGAGWGQDGDVAYLYTRTQNAPPVFPLPPLSELRTQPQYPNSHPDPAAQPCYRPAAAQPSASSHCSRHPQPTHTAPLILQAFLHKNLPTQQKYNFVPFKSQK